MSPPTEILALCAGPAATFRGQERSAIAKRPLTERVRIGRIGLAGDAQADLVHHGGAEMAVHHYPHDHYAWWRAEIGDHPLLGTLGALGENVSTAGLIEDAVCIGDRFRLGSVLLEVTQPRNPCWKIEHRFGRKGMVARILSTGHCGWYYRVLEEGEAQTGDMLEKIDSGHVEWSVARVFAALYGPERAARTQELPAIAGLARLSARLREKIVGSLA